MTFLLSIILASAIAALAWRRRDWTIGLIAAGTPLYVARFEIGGIPLTALELMVLALVASWCVSLVKRPAERAHLYELLGRSAPQARVIRIALYLCTMLIATSIMAILVTPDFRAGLGLWKAYIIEPILFFIVVVHTLRSEKQFRFVATALLISGSIVAILALVQAATGIGIPEPWHELSQRRATAHYGYPNAVGLFLAPLLALTLGWLLHSHAQLTARGRRALLVCATLLFSALIAARVEGALVAVAAALFVLLLFTRARWFSVAAAILGLVGGLAYEPVRRILLFQDVSGDVRLALWRGTWNMLSHLPWFGAGLSGFPLTYDLYRLNQHVELLQYPHNIFLNFWSELGFAGLVWIVTVLLLILYILLRRIRMQERSPRNNTAASSTDTALFEHSHWPYALLAVFTCITVYGLVDVPIMKNDLSILFALWCALAVLLALKKQR